MENPWQHLMHFLPRVDSTMHAARTLAQAGAAHGTTVVAREQTHGRGRRGRTWSSPPGHGLAMTTLLRPANKPALHTLSLVAAVAVRRAAMALGAQSVVLKWPNDVWVMGRKLAGILLEADHVDPAAPVVLVGIGVNVGPVALAPLPKEVRDLAVGLVDAGVALVPPAAPSDDSASGFYDVEDRAIEALRVQTAHAVAAALHDAYAAWSTGGVAAILAEWAQADALAGQPVRAELEGGWLEGLACGLDNSGQLQIRTAEGLRLVQSGQVERVRPQKNGPVAVQKA